MKKLLIYTSLFVFFTPSVLKAQKCFDYACNINRARTALSQKQFKDALDYTKAAKAYPNANVVEADALMYKIFDAIDAQKKIAEEAKKLAQQEAEKARLAKEIALTQAEIARQEKLKAETATQRAEKTARAAENSAVIMRTLNAKPGLALRMLYYNYMQHPENSMTRDLYHKTIQDPKTVFVRQVLRDTDNVEAVALSPDGKKVLVSNKKDKIKLFDLASGRLEKYFQYKSRYSGSVKTLMFSPNGKKILIVGSSDTLVSLWDIERGQIERTFPDHKYLNALAMSPDGKKLLTGDSDKTRLWDVESGQVEKTYNGYTSSVAYSPNGKKALINGGGIVVLWDLLTEQADTLSTSNDIRQVRFSPDGKKALFSEYRQVHLWDIATKRKEKSYSQTEVIDDSFFSPDGSKILISERVSYQHNDYEQSKLWDIKTEQVEKVLVGEGVAFTPDGKGVLVKDFADVKLCHIAFDLAEKTLIQGEEVRAVAFSADGKKVLTGGGRPYGPPYGNNNMVKMWDVANGQEEKTFLGHESYLVAVTFSPDGRKVWSANDGANLLRWDTSGLKEPNAIKEKEFTQHVSFSKNREKVLFYNQDTIKQWNLETEQFDSTYTYKPRLMYSPDGKKVLTVVGNVVQLKDLLTGQIEKTFVGHSSSVFDIAFSPDGKKILTGSKDHTAKIWDIEANSIEGWTYPFSLYDMVVEGFIVEKKDTPQVAKERILLAKIAGKQRPRVWIPDYAPEFYTTEILDTIGGQVNPPSVSNADLTKISAFKTDIVDSLLNVIDGETDTLKTYQHYGVLIDTLKNRQIKSAEDPITLMDTYGERAWLGLFIHKYTESEQDIRSGLAIDNTDIILHSNLPLALLLQGKFKEAKAEYVKWMDKPFDEDQPTFRDVFLEDLKSLEDAGKIPKERRKDVAAIRKLLEKE